MALFQKCVRQFDPSTNMASTAELGKGPSKDHSTKAWLRLAQWFLRRRFLCEFPIGSYVKLSSAVGAILIEGPNRLTHFWKRTIQWLFHQNFVLIPIKIFLSETICSIRTKFWWNSHWMVLFQKCVRRFGPSIKMAPTAELSEGGHPRIIPQKFDCNWPSGFWGEDFYVNFP
jgi:hypothetical protein